MFLSGLKSLLLVTMKLNPFLCLVSESDPGDLWYDDEFSCEDSMEKAKVDREWQKRRNQFHTVF